MYRQENLHPLKNICEKIDIFYELSHFYIQTDIDIKYVKIHINLNRIHEKFVRKNIIKSLYQVFQNLLLIFLNRNLMELFFYK